MRKEEADIGRCGEFRRPISVEELVERLSEGLGIRPESIRIATGDREGADGSELRSQSGIMHRCRGRSSADGAKAWMRCLCDRRCKIS